MSPCSRCQAELPRGAPVCPRCALPGNALDTIGGLLLGEELGRGGMGVVYRAHDPKLGRAVAVKFLAPELAKDPDVRARFEREARALGLLQHPNIVAVHRFGQEDGEAFLVMEFVEGKPVSAALPRTPADAVKIGLQLCLALSAAHQKGVIHRDIKPENVLQTADGTVKVTDFGIARLVAPEHRGHTITRSDAAVGTHGYMAPEIFQGAPPDPRMDVYGVGALLRTLVTGRAPVGEAGDLPGALGRVVRRAMAERPEDRFGSMAELHRALEHVLPWLDRVRLPPDERLWMRAVAPIGTGAVGAWLWAFVLSVTPKLIAPHERIPLVMVGGERLPDGGLYSRVRFETVPILVAVVAAGVAIATYGLLRRHWRLEGLDVPNPAPVIPESRVVFWIGLVSCTLFALHRGLEALGVLPSEGGAAAFLPLLGGMVETIALYFFLLAVLEAQRRSRPLSGERLLLLGMALTLIPPTTDLLQTLLRAAP